MGEILMSRDEGGGAEASAPQSFFRSWQLEGIDVQAEQASGRLNALEKRERVPATAERAVDGDIARRRAQASQSFRQHDRPMQIRRQRLRHWMILEVPW